ncbi:ArsR/SmtB family transcription factor [Gluconobacter morbifer]|nr:metalloregulator ArsR/SmtB family transcription factor [Gluconobacter morbifer]
MTLLSLDESRILTDWLRLLAQPQRLMILSALMDGTHAVSELETLTGIGQPTLSQHLGALRRAGFIESRRESRTIFYCMASTLDAARARTLLLTLRPGAPVPDTIGVQPSQPLLPTPPTSDARFARILRNNGR